MSKADLAAMGIGIADTTDDQAELETLAANDPFMADLLASMEQATPDPVELLEKITARDSEAGADEATAEVPGEEAPEAPPAKPSDLIKPGEKAPATEAPELPTGPEPTTAPTAIADTFVVDLGNGQTSTLDQSTAQRLLGLEEWAKNLQNTPGLVEAMSAVEDGRAIPIPRDEYEKFQAWKASSPTAPAPAATLPPLDEYADDATKALYATVQALQSQVERQNTQAIDSQRQQYEANLQAHLDARAATFQTAFESAGTQYGLSDAEVNAALASAAQSRLIQTVNEELTHKSPTGQIIREADPAEVARITFERALFSHPELRQKAIDAEVQTRLDAERASITSINQKKARASSLSTAPAAATTSNRDVRSMSPQEREAAIAAELRAAIAAA